MNRTEGLVRRVKFKPESSDAGLSSASNGANGSNENLDRDEETEDFGSKETRLTLMEEVLLLGLKDKEVYHTSSSSLPFSLMNLIGVASL